MIHAALSALSYLYHTYCNCTVSYLLYTFDSCPTSKQFKKIRPGAIFTHWCICKFHSNHLEFYSTEVVHKLYTVVHKCTPLNHWHSFQFSLIFTLSLLLDCTLAQYAIYAQYAQYAQYAIYAQWQDESERAL